MTTYILTQTEQLETLFTSLKKQLENGKTVLWTGNFEGMVYAPSQKKKYFRCGTPCLAPDVFAKPNDVSALMNSAMFFLAVLDNKHISSKFQDQQKEKSE